MNQTIRKRIKISLLFLSGFFFTANISAQELETYTYYTNDSISLELDLFLPDDAASNTPLVIYVHGGGFGAGNRAGGHKLAQHLVEQGIACASITYTLYMKDRGFGCDAVLSEKIKAIQLAASQLWLATDYLLEQSDRIRIDPEKIFIAGSSAGAEVVMHAAFWDRTQMQLFEQKLDTTFKYAGVISGAGAIMDLNLITSDNQLPLMLFHGDADPLVPHGTAAHHYCPPDSPGWLMFFGSSSIAKHVQGLGGICHFTSFKGGGHSFAGAYFYQNQKPVSRFIHRVLSGESFVNLEVVAAE